MPKKLTREDFIQKAKAVHGDKYDYSKVEYIDAYTPVIIGCKKGHGYFQMKPTKHTDHNQGCPDCSISKRINTSEYIQRALIKWGEMYSYDKTVYSNNHTKIVVTCAKHGDYTVSPREHIKRGACPYCRDTGILDKEEFLDKAHQVHGNKYDYSKVEFINKTTKVCLICDKGHEFWQIPADHINNHGCNLCAKINSRTSTYGVGINDMDGLIKSRSIEHKYYKLWQIMHCRCYDPKWHEKEPTYKNCSVCDEWKLLSNFISFCRENYVDGFELDKDILSINGVKVYSPETCAFIPQEINKLLSSNKKNRGTYPMGVSYHKAAKLFTSQINKKGKRIHLGCYATPEEAFNVYKTERELYIKDIAKEYFDKGLITERVKNALYKYEITEDN